ncbi:hypothetical protein D3C78_1047720 [compost metagenome]
MHHHLQGFTQIGLVAEQQADLAKVRQLAVFRHAQTQAAASTDPGRQLEQLDDGRDGNPLVGDIQHRGTESGLCQQAGGVQSQLAGDVEIIGKGSGSGEEGHITAPMTTAHMLTCLLLTYFYHFIYKMRSDLSLVN